MLREISCTKRGCGCKILRKSNDGMWRFSTKVIKTDESGAGVIAVCKDCGTENYLPIQLSIPSLLPENLPANSLLRKGFAVAQAKKTS